MGQSIAIREFTQQDYQFFTRKLNDNLSALEQLLQNDEFGTGPMSIGAELELSIIDSHGHARCINTEILDALQDPHMQPELNQFNLEFNLPHTAFMGRAFNTLEQHIQNKLSELNQAAAQHQAQVVSIGILPTLRLSDVERDCMTDLPRYHTLSQGIKQMRGEPFRINIDGKQPLQLDCDDLTIEGANTSFQLHLRVPPQQYANTYNAVQLVTPLALALGANSPFLLGQQLWDETRVVLFKQAVDIRTHHHSSHAKTPPRVNFGHGWVRKSALELFAESVALFKPLLPITYEQDPLQCLRQGTTPKLHELRLHQSSIWQWNRAIFDHHEGGHLRIEMRALPSGPTPMDMLANSAFLVGAALSLRNQMDRILPSFPFRYAENNFYRAAQNGMRAQLLWPSNKAEYPKARNVGDIALQLIPQATDALIEHGIDVQDAKHYMDIIKTRIAANTNGSNWQQRIYEQYRKTMPHQQALQAMLSQYIDNQRLGIAVAEWSTSI